MNELLDLLKKIKPEVDFISNNNLVSEGILDSLDIVKIISEIEKTYKIEIFPEEIDPNNFQSYQAIYRMIEKKIR